MRLLALLVAVLLGLALAPHSGLAAGGIGSALAKLLGKSADEAAAMTRNLAETAVKHQARHLDEQLARSATALGPRHVDEAASHLIKMFDDRAVAVPHEAVDFVMSVVRKANLAKAAADDGVASLGTATFPRDALKITTAWAKRTRFTGRVWARQDGKFMSANENRFANSMLDALKNNKQMAPSEVRIMRQLSQEIEQSKAAGRELTELQRELLKYVRSKS